MIDIHLEGYPYTWAKSPGTDRAVEERRDRALATNDWFFIHPWARLKNLMALMSDHSPILLDSEDRFFLSKARRFKFENVWL